MSKANINNLKPPINKRTREEQREITKKGGSRKDKLKLIESVNPDWNDLYDTIV